MIEHMGFTFLVQLYLKPVWVRVGVRFEILFLTSEILIELNCVL